jgi:hypothetical protein
MANQFSDKENRALLNDLKVNNNRLDTKRIQDMVVLWPGLFPGTERNERSLFEQTKKIAKKENLPCLVISAPKRDRSNWTKPGTVSPRTTKGKMFEQILAIVQDEIRLCIPKAAKRILRLIEIQAEENIELRKELRDLKSYQQGINQKYQTELSNKGGSAS